MAEDRELTHYEKMLLGEIENEMKKLSKDLEVKIKEKLEVGSKEAKEIVSNLLEDSRMIVNDPHELLSILNGERGVEKVRDLLQKHVILDNINFAFKTVEPVKQQFNNTTI
ncbi:MAG: hypothetical protein KAQ64_01975 [Candidatus Pacebacteria bacterium]|nr:hypothetical protein [Candidatus Paceibacterota bacterium]